MTRFSDVENRKFRLPIAEEPEMHIRQLRPAGNHQIAAIEPTIFTFVLELELEKGIKSCQTVFWTGALTRLVCQPVYEFR